jgi:asparagine synthase (glutamine-hydrolysing)
LHSPLVELLGRVPSSLKAGRLRRLKWLLKQALADRLPPEILARRTQGFGVPFATGFRGPLAPALREILSGEQLRAGGVFDPVTVRRLVADHVGGRANHARVLWALVAFECWRVSYLGGRLAA